MKKRYFIVLFCCALFLLFPTGVKAAGGDCSFQEGNFGDRVSWKFEGATLTISGTGSMSGRYTYAGEYDDLMPPWAEYYWDIYTVKVEEGVVYIGQEAFAQLKNCDKISIANTVYRIGRKAFQNCARLPSITIPDSVTIIGELAFDGCSALKSIYFTGTETQWNAIQIAHNAIPQNVTIYYNAPSEQSSAPFSIVSVPRAEYGGTVIGKELSDIETVSVRIANLKGSTQSVRALVAFYTNQHQFLGAGMCSVSLAGGTTEVEIPIKNRISDASRAQSMKVLLLDEHFCPLIPAQEFHIDYEHKELEFFPY